MGHNSEATADSAGVGFAHWRPDLTERLRVLLHSKPLFDLKRSEGLRAEELRHYDTLSLSVKICDLIVENMGLDTEIDRGNLPTMLSPLLTSADRAAGVEPSELRHRIVVEQVLGSLSNESERRRPFEVVYQDFDEIGDAVSRKLEFRLLWDYLLPSGGTALRLTNEAINLYLRAWDLDIEDAQAAAEAVVLSQLSRGKLDEAVQSARNARLQSLRYWDKIFRVIRDTRRDVHRVDWNEETPRLLDEALAHVKARTGVEASILNTARDRLNVLEVNDQGARAVAEVCRLIEDCRQRHFDLHGQLMDARNVFLDEQERQAFQPRTSALLPSLTDDVLVALLKLSHTEATKVLNDAAAPLVGPVAPQLLSLATLLPWMLQPRRATTADEAPIETGELVPFGNELLRYPEDIRERGDAMLQDIEAPTRLSTLLAAVSDWDGAPELQEYLVLSTLRYFAPEKDDFGDLVVSKKHDANLIADRFVGDELVLSKTENNHEHAAK
jgi:hypothetical protein